jgi:hypothetical protein
VKSTDKTRTFIFLEAEYKSLSKFLNGERELVKSIVANLTIKRIADSDIIKVIFDQTNKTITDRYLRTIRQQIKRESYHWYKTMREGEYEYIHEFKERINEILFLQKKHHQIIMRNEDNPQVQQTSLAELHRLSITLSNLYDVAPTIIGVGANATISITPETKTGPTTREFIV